MHVRIVLFFLTFMSQHDGPTNGYGDPETKIFFSFYTAGLQQ